MKLNNNKYKQKGFTLIELLGVIVILAIIAVIATPIIIGVIEEVRKDSFTRSVELVVSATDINMVDKSYKKEYVYYVSNGVISDNVKVEHIENMNGNIAYNKEGKVSYVLHNKEYCVQKDFLNDAVEITKYNKETCKTKVAITSYINGTEVYFDVANGELCSKEDYHVDNSLTGYNGLIESKTTDNQNSCLKFYIFNSSQSDEKVKLLLDHNTTGTIYWSDENTEINEEGPIQVLNALKLDTNGWLGTQTPSNYTVFQEGAGDYDITYDDEGTENDFKARLITAKEVADITGNGNFFEATTSHEDYYNFDTNSKLQSDTCQRGATAGCQYGWLYDRTNSSCTTFGCLNNSRGNEMTGYGYWTATSTFGNSKNAWCVYWDATLYNHAIDVAAHGVRPVIEILNPNI